MGSACFTLPHPLDGKLRIFNAELTFAKKTIVTQAFTTILVKMHFFKDCVSAVCGVLQLFNSQSVSTPENFRNCWETIRLIDFN